LTEDQVTALWRKAQRKPAYYVGFIVTLPDNIPEPAAAHPLSASSALGELADSGNPLAALMQRVLDAPGQAFLKTALRILEKPSNQEVVNISLDAIADFFSAARPEGRIDATLEALQGEAEQWSETDESVRALRAVAGLTPDKLLALRVLSGLSYGVVRPVFGDSTAIGSLMRKKLLPVAGPLRELLESLRADQSPGSP